jgi:hypothetical protein
VQFSFFKTGPFRPGCGQIKPLVTAGVIPAPRWTLEIAGGCAPNLGVSESPRPTTANVEVQVQVEVTVPALARYGPSGGRLGQVK